MIIMNSIRGTKADGREPITIAYLIDRFGQGGGTENQLAALINNMDKEQFRPIIINLRPEADEHLIDVDCPVIYLGVSKLASIRALAAVWRLFRLLRSRRVKILQTYFIDSTIIGIISGRLAGVNRIVVARRDMGLWYKEHRLAWTNQINRFAHYCLANAQAIKEIVLKTDPFREDQIKVIHNGIDRGLPVESTLTRSALGIPDGVPLMVIVASLKPIKRIDAFLRIGAAAGIHMLIVGEGPQRTEMEELAGALGVDNRTTFYHTVDRIFDILKLCDIGVLTSRSEGLSNVLIEYALAGLPAIAFDTGGNGEVIDDNRTGYLVEQDNEQLFADQVRLLMADESLRRRIGQAARQHAENRFGVKRMVTETESFYRGIL